MNNNMNPTTNNWLVIYNTIKQDRIKYLRKNFSGKRKKFGKYPADINHKKPWFMLTKGKCINYGPVKETWGTCIDLHKVPSETKVFGNKNVLYKKINHVEYMEGFAQHKLNKWIKHNPKPCKDDDLFALQYIPQWEKQKEEALIHFRNIIISIYDKIKIYGRYRIGNDKFTEGNQKEKYIHANGYPIKIGEIKDKYKELINKSVNDLDKDSKILTKARIIAIKEHKKHPNLVSALMKDFDGHKGRIII